MEQLNADALNQPSQNTDLEEEWEDGDDDEDYDDEDGDEDIDAEAEEIARRLGEQLWADITKANDTQAAASELQNEPPPNEPLPLPAAAALNTFSRKEEDIFASMNAILKFVADDPLARATLASTAVPTLEGINVLDVLQNCTSTRSVTKATAMSLYQVLVTLASSESLFGTLRLSNASAIQLDIGKRKRDETDELSYAPDFRAYKRPYMPDNDLHNQVAEAVRVIGNSLGPTSSQPLDPALVSSIRLQLHQVFLFAVTSSAGGGPEMHALQEISGLIQVIGVLSGIQIGQPPESLPNIHNRLPPNPAQPWLQQTPFGTGIGTAVYPCLIAGCKKTFSRLYSLRAHQRSHAVHRPFRCNACPASFARNHDLKRHIKLHGKKAWKCAGCQKIFSRRDAIKRHKTGTKTKGPKSEICLTADVLEVELDEEGGEDSIREERRAKLWNGIATSQANAPHHSHRDISVTEEGEILPASIASIQGAVMSLHGLLQARVGNALGSGTQPATPAPDPSKGQLTLANVIAKAQLQNLPPTATAPSAIQNITTVGDIPQINSPNEPLPSNGDIGEKIAEDHAGASLSMYGLSDEQTKMLELAIANAASAAQAQAEAEAALEEKEEGDDEDEDDDFDLDEEEYEPAGDETDQPIA